MGDADKPNHDQTDKHSIDDQDAASVSDSARSPSKEISRHRLSLSFLHTAPVTPNSPAPEALPAFSKSQNVSQSNLSQASLGRTPSQSTRPETSKSVKSESSKKGSSMKKRLSFMNISKKSSKNSVRGKQQDSLAEE
jgi:dedicator of cytokinesis protein 3